MTDAEDAERARLDLVHNERVKLRATYLNGMAIAVLAVGGFAPLASYINSSATAASSGVASGLVLVCMIISWTIHRVAQRGLGDMK